MISHKHKCIFIHIPKCAGTTVRYLLFPNEEVNWDVADYDKVHGYCPKQKFFMQHATANQLIETGLVSKDVWDSYYKFTFIRNPWDRAVSDYFWMMKDRKIKDSFKNYILKSGKFAKVLNDKGKLYYRGDHTTPQTDFFDLSGPLKMDYVGHIESFETDIQNICNRICLNFETGLHVNKSIKKKKHYSFYFNDHIKEIFYDLYKDDIDKLGYQFEEVKEKFSFNNLFKF